MCDGKGVAAATVLLGAGIGTLGSTINPFATVIAANADAGIRLGIVLCIMVISDFMNTCNNKDQDYLMFG